MVDVTFDKAAIEEVERRTGRRSIPVVVRNGAFVAGFDRAALDRLLT